MPRENDLTGDSSVENLQQIISVNDIYDDDDDDDSLVENNTNLSSEEEEDDDEAPLGLVKKLERDWSVVPNPDLSIAGGFPAWLDPINLPSGSSTICDFCGHPLQFLLHVYAPDVVEKTSTFHRTIYVFMCLSMTCLLHDQHEQRKPPSDNPYRRSVKVFRCQLPRSNSFYAYEASDRHPEFKPAALCSWCRTWIGSSVCGHCKTARYCSKKHQAAHWRIGHDIECRNLAVDRQHTTSPSFVASNTIWPQFEIVLEDEPNKVDTISENGGYGTELASAGHVDEGFDPLLDSFEADAVLPGEVLRCCRDARPLWPMPSVRPSHTDIPNCSYCRGPRCCELQIMPQLLSHFRVQNDVNSLDWSTIVIYSCEASCDASMAYKQEFAWVQLPS